MVPSDGFTISMDLLASFMLLLSDERIGMQTVAQRTLGAICFVNLEAQATCAQGVYALSSRGHEHCPSFHVLIADRATSLDEVLSDQSATDGFVFSKGLHCKTEQPGVVFIENRCPGSVVLVFKVLFHWKLDTFISVCHNPPYK
jgi:hypothetical protein